MTGRRWYLIHGLYRTAVAELSSRLPKTVVEKAAHAISDYLKAPLELMSGTRGAPRLSVHGTVRSNPTLVHHGLATQARWHVVTASTSSPIADLYSVEPETASRIATEIATATNVPMLLMSNRGLPRTLGSHSIVRERSGSTVHRPSPRRNPATSPLPGQTWRKRGGGSVRVTSVGDGRVAVTNLSSGNREWVDRADFMALYTLAAGRPNPKRKRRKAATPGRSYQARRKAQARSARDRRRSGSSRRKANPKGRNPRLQPGYVSVGATTPTFRLNDGTVVGAWPGDRGPRHYMGRQQATTALAKLPDAHLFEVFRPAAGRSYYFRFVGPEPNRRKSRVKRRKSNPLPRWVDPRSIRTVGHGATRIRVGCPKGKWSPARRRCKVGTSMVESVKVRRTAHQRNPRESEVVRARRTFRRLNQIDPGTTRRVSGARNAPKVAVKLGELVSFRYRSNKYAGSRDNPHGKTLLYEHRTKRPRPVLATDPDGREVHIVGGRMHPTPDGLVN